MSKSILDVRLTIEDREDDGDVFLKDSDTRTEYSVRFTTDGDESWPEVMRKLQGCVEAYYGYTFNGYGCRADEEL